MRKSKIFISCIMAIVLMFVICTKVNAVTLDCQVPDKVNAGENFEIVLKADKKISALTAYFEYNANLVELVTSGSVVKSSDGAGKIAYATMNAETDTLKVSFKAKDSSTAQTAKFTFKDISVATEDFQEGTFNKEIEIVVGGSSTSSESGGNNTFVIEPSSGSNIQTTTTQTTTSSATKKLSKTGENDFMIAIVIISIIAVIFFVKNYRKSKKLFILLPVMFAFAFAGGRAEAVELPSNSSKADMGFLAETYENSINVIGISPKDSFVAIDPNGNNDEFYLSDLGLFSSSELGGVRVYSASNEEKDSSAKLCTGDRILYTANNTETVSAQIVIYGDANGDGKICDGLDMNVVIADFLNKDNDPTYTAQLKRVAANLMYDRESGTYLSKLNAFDINRMIAKYMDTENARNALGTSLISDTNIVGSKKKLFDVTWYEYPGLGDGQDHTIYANANNEICVPKSCEFSAVVRSGESGTWSIVSGNCISKQEITEGNDTDTVFTANNYGDAVVKFTSSDGRQMQYSIHVVNSSLALGSRCYVMDVDDEMEIELYDIVDGQSVKIDDFQLVLVDGTSVSAHNKKITAKGTGVAHVRAVVTKNNVVIGADIQVSVINVETNECTYSASGNSEKSIETSNEIVKVHFDKPTTLTVNNSGSTQPEIATKKIDDKTYIIRYLGYMTGGTYNLVASNSDNNNKINISVTFNQTIIAHKPIIYLYPTTETKLDVTLGYEENLTCTYPKYDGGWNVTAYPDGTLIDNKSNKKLYSLYWEGYTDIRTDESEGFVVAGEDVAEFLDEKLEILGLNYKEREEFIVYWLPILEANKYNYIRFATKAEIDEGMPLNFSVEPDSVIRVLMQFKGLDEYKEVTEQKLETPKRDGFVAVEWGGANLK